MLRVATMLNINASASLEAVGASLLNCPSGGSSKPCAASLDLALKVPAPSQPSSSFVLTQLDGARGWGADPLDLLAPLPRERGCGSEVHPSLPLDLIAAAQAVNEISLRPFFASLTASPSSLRSPTKVKHSSSRPSVFLDGVLDRRLDFCGGLSAPVT